jgi:uncharacterized SAM-binding protein YcdF (DUF218 family)
MFFLSKFLPLFVYPLGLACLLLVVAIATLWQRPRITAFALVGSLTLLLLAGNSGVAHTLLWSLESQYLPTAPLPNAAAIVVLGGATHSADPPRPWVEVTEAGDRLLYAAKLYRQGKAPLIILSGGRVPWLGGGLPEAADMATLITTMGVPISAIRQDDRSFNTHENAINVQQILKAEQITSPVLLVTSAFHMPRALAIFQHLGISAIAAPTDFRTGTPQTDKNLGRALIHLFPDAAALAETTLALKEYLGWIIYRLQGWL